MPRYAGGKALIIVGVGGAASAVVPSLSQFTLNKTTDKIEVTAFGDLNKVYVQGLPDIKGTINGFFDSSNDALFDAAEASTPSNLYLYPSSLVPTQYSYGPAWIDASLSVDVKGSAAVSASFSASGSWGRF